MAFKLSLTRIFPRVDAPITILSNIMNSVTNSINEFAMLFTSFENRQIHEYIEKSQNIQRQMLDILLPSQENFSRLNLRLLLDLPPFEEDPEAIRSLEGAISNITKEKIDVIEIIRNMRDTR